MKLLGHSQTWRKHLTLESSKQSHDKMLRISLIFKGLHTQKSKKITFLSRVFKFIQHNTFREIKNWSYYDKFSFLFLKHLNKLQIYTHVNDQEIGNDVNSNLVYKIIWYPYLQDERSFVWNTVPIKVWIFSFTDANKKNAFSHYNFLTQSTGGK